MNWPGHSARVVVVVMLLASPLPFFAFGAQNEPAAGVLAADHVPPVVIAVEENGMNPYHEAFRRPDMLDPRVQIPAYPQDALPLPLTLDASSYEDAVTRDRHLWDGLQTERLYFVPGTKIVGIYWVNEKKNDQEIAFLESVHGTPVADSAVGSAAGSSTDSVFVIVKADNEDMGVDWIGNQSWIDLYSSSKGAWGGVSAPGRIRHAEQIDLPNGAIRVGAYSAVPMTYKWWLSGRTSFSGSGNGPTAGGLQTFTSQYTPPWVITVGGVREMEQPEVCIECDRPIDLVTEWGGDRAIAGSLDGYAELYGTSLSSPRMAGFAAELIQAARQRLGDHDGFTNGAYAEAVSGVTLPARGPLADGRFTNDELEWLLLQSATPIDWCHWPYSVYLCVGASEEANYWYQGYGFFTEANLVQALQILLGEAAPPEPRPWDDYWHATINALSWAYWGPWLCRSDVTVEHWGECPLIWDGTADGVVEATRKNPLLPGSARP